MRRTLLLLSSPSSPSPRRPRCAGRHGPRRRGPAVPIYNAAFAVPHVDVLAGDTVTWHNDSVRAHNVNADDGSFASPRLLHGGTFGHRFDAPGDVRVLLPAAPVDARRRRRPPPAARRREGAGRRRQAVRAVRPRRAARGQHGLDRGRRRRRRHREGRRGRRVHRHRHAARDDRLHGGRRRRVRPARAGARARPQGQRDAVRSAGRSSSIDATRHAGLAGRDGRAAAQASRSTSAGGRCGSRKLDSASRVRFTLPRGRKVSARACC